MASHQLCFCCISKDYVKNNHLFGTLYNNTFRYFIVQVLSILLGTTSLGHTLYLIYFPKFKLIPLLIRTTHHFIPNNSKYSSTGALFRDMQHNIQIISPPTTLFSTKSPDVWAQNSRYRWPNRTNRSTSTTDTTTSA